LEDKILILDFGSQYTQLIARRIRELKVYSEIRPYYTTPEEVLSFSPKGIILSGGPSSIYDPQAPLCSKEILQLQCPVLGICYGMQLMAHLLGGQVEKAEKGEYGKAYLEILDNRDLFQGLPQKIQVWMSHGDRVLALPPGFEVLARTENSPYAAIANRERALYGLQFHPEVAHTPRGKTILSNFLFNICKCKPTWTMESFLDRSIEDIKKRVGKERVLCALSGGVDSSVVALMVHKAVGNQLICIFVDNGLLRQGEAERVRETFARHFKMNVRFVNAAERFLKRLKGVTDPEAKRKIIGEEFIRVFEEEAKKLGKVSFLAQGTLYPDVIESVSVKGPSAVIKSHHNVGGLPERLSFQLLEPLRELFKDEVRELGRLMGIPQEIVGRQPFPGPGLGVRIVGEVTQERLRILREADAIVEEEIKKEGLYYKIWQSFAVLLPVKTVGVMGDERTYEYAIAIRAVESLDGMTADWVKLPYHLLERLSNRIINEVKGVNRVVYDISSKPPSTIEWE